MEPAKSVDNPVAVPASADPQRCSRCSGSLQFELRLEPPSEQSYGHRILSVRSLRPTRVGR